MNSVHLEYEYAFVKRVQSEQNWMRQLHRRLGQHQ